MDAFMEVLLGDKACEDRLPVLCPKVPLQDNCCECAVFLLQYVEEIMQRWPHITQKDVEGRCVGGFGPGMFTRGQMKAKRGQLKGLINHLRCAHRS